MSDEISTPAPTNIVAAMYPNNDRAPSPVPAPAASKPDTALTEVTPAKSPENPPAATDAPLPVGAPEKYELALKDVALDQGLLSQAEPVFRELGLTNQQANALLPLAPKIMERAESAIIERMIAGGNVQRKEWADAFNADQEIGGAQRSESVRLAAKGMDALGFGKDHPFRSTLNETGFGNHPDMIRTLRAIGQLVGADGRLAGGRPNVGRNVPVWEAMYPNG